MIPLMSWLILQEQLEREVKQLAAEKRVREDLQERVFLKSLNMTAQEWMKYLDRVQGVHMRLYQVMRKRA